MSAKISTKFNFSIASIAFLLLFIRCTSSAPIETIYAKFMTDMNMNKCTSPEQMKIPSNSSTGEKYEYLSSYLNVCHNLETIERSKEALYLCREILDNLKSILCPPISVNVIANSGNTALSKEVCKDIGALKDAVPENKVVFKRLTDSFTCDIMCEGVFEKACQVLLWSYQLQPLSAAENPNKEAQEMEIKADHDKTKTEENKTIKKTTVAVQQTQVTDEVKQQSTNNLFSNMQQTGTVVKQETPNQILEQQSNLHIAPKNPSTNNLPFHQNNLVLNNSFTDGLQLPKVEEINSNDLPEQDTKPQNIGIPEQEDPHDQAEELSHNVDVADDNVQPSQNLDNQKSPGLPITNESSSLPNNESPDLPNNGKSHLQAKVPQLNANEGLIEPHDEEEDIGEVDRNETEQKLPVVVSETSKQQGNVGHTNLNNEANVQLEAAIKNVATTKVGSTGGTTKNAITTTIKKPVDEVKTSPVGETQVTDGQKTTEHSSSLPSQKEGADSSVASPTSKVLSLTTPALEKMEEEDDVHEMPEDREPDQYNGKIFEPAKNKEISPDEVEVSKVNIMRPREPSFDDLSLVEKYGRQSTFPEQEDGHFFFYFLSIVLILMAGYLLFHNKQKIIALIVEGRHERRRRSHGVGYKKLETK